MRLMRHRIVKCRTHHSITHVLCPVPFLWSLRPHLFEIEYVGAGQLSAPHQEKAGNVCHRLNFIALSRNERTLVLECNKFQHKTWIVRICGTLHH
jgi:hypothetical protein